jgi:hypothetical protein
MKAWTPYRAFRFGLYLPGKDKFIGCSAIHTDPFTGELWVTRAHLRDEPTLEESLSAVKVAQVYFFDRTEDGIASARMINVTWTKHRWVPIDLDAADSNVALERLVLTGTTYSAVKDVAKEDVPASFKLKVA